MDSLTAVELRNRLLMGLGISIAVTSLMDYPTLESLLEFLADQLLVPGLSNEAVATAVAAAVTPLETTEAIGPPIVTDQRSEPIAIIGMGCRFPGGADTLDAFWDLLHQGTDAITEIPADRWSLEQYYDPNVDAVGKMYTRYGGFVDHLKDFDASFFGIAPREVGSLDPQQRLLLEVVWETLESANLPPAALKDIATGVFIGICSNDYSHHLLAQGTKQIDAYLATGNAHSTATGRISHLLGFTGPCLSVDTACSSSLVALHLACMSLRNGESDVALTGGVNRILSPVNTINFCKARMLATDGRCKTFDIGADGFVRAEGCGVVMLKRLADAQRDGDRILALIRGSAINQDGHTSGLTVPNGPSQQAVIQQALQAAQVTPAAISYVEAHGTGTSLGDPIEVGALGAVFGESHSTDQPLPIGSVKTNIGHLEAAAGMAGLIKVVLQLQHQVIAPHLHLHTPTPYIDWADAPVTIPTQALTWDRNQKPRLAGLSSFGFSGTNAHVIVEEAPVVGPSQPITEQPSWQLLTLSAKGQPALQQLAKQYEGYLASWPDVDLANVCFSTQVGRAHFEQRLALVGRNKEDLLAQLRAWQSDEHVSRGTSNKSKIAVLFTGQGSQYVNMARELYETQPTFRQTLEQCSEILSAYLERPLLDVLYPDERTEQAAALLNQTAYTQPVLFAIEYALYQLWYTWGIRPSVVIGHSIGEIVAACVAGVFSLEDGLKLSAMRGQLMQQLPPGGTMVSVMASAECVRAAIAGQADVTIAAINGPESTVISGASAAVEKLAQALTSEGIKIKSLTVSHAFHSVLMQPMVAEFEQVARQVQYANPRIKFISNVTGQVVTDAVATPEYWGQHILAPVNFAAGIETLHQQGYETFLEVGPQPILLGMGRLCLPPQTGTWLPSLRSGQSDWRQLLTSLGELYAQGVPVDWAGFYRDYPQHRKVTLPTYPFQRQRYWIEEAATPSYDQARLLNAHSGHKIHPLLGQQLHSAALKRQEIQFEAHLSAHSPAFLSDHCVYQTPIFPATAYIEMALAAGTQISQSDYQKITNVIIPSPLILSASADQPIQTLLTPETGSVYTWEIFSLDLEQPSAPDWRLHASGKILAYEPDSLPRKVDLVALKADFLEAIAVADFYQQLRSHGLEYGPAFQAVKQLWRRPEEALAEIESPLHLTDLENWHLPPVLLDACWQILGAVLSADQQTDTYLPIGFDSLQVFSPCRMPLWSHVQLCPTDLDKPKTRVANIQLMTPDGEIIATVEGLRLQQVDPAMLLGGPSNPYQDWLYQIEWRSQALSIPATFNHLPIPAALDAVLTPQSADSLATKAVIENPITAIRHWLILADQQGVGEQLSALMQAKGDRCSLVMPGVTYEQQASQRFSLNPSRAEDFHTLLQDLANEALPEL